MDAHPAGGFKITLAQGKLKRENAADQFQWLPSSCIEGQTAPGRWLLAESRCLTALSICRLELFGKAEFVRILQFSACLV